VPAGQVALIQREIHAAPATEGHALLRQVVLGATRCTTVHHDRRAVALEETRQPAARDIDVEHGCQEDPPIRVM
jgi:hypothetical protein